MNKINLRLTRRHFDVPSRLTASQLQINLFEREAVVYKNREGPNDRYHPTDRLSFYER